MKQLLLLALCAIGFNLSAQIKEIKTTINGEEVIYHLENLQKTGDYTVKYANGNLKIKGQYKYNKRNGAWEFYKEDGSFVIAHYYAYGNVFKTFMTLEDLNTFKNEVSNPSMDTPPPPPMMIPQMITTSGYETLPKIFQEDILWSQRLMRKVYVKENYPLQQGNFVDSLLSAVKKGKIKTYSPINDQFTKEYTYEDVAYTGQTIIGYKIKEDWFYNGKTKKLDMRIVGICPIIKENQEEKDLCWFYYNGIRSVLGKSLYDAGMMKKSYDDFFIHYNYKGEVIKYSNPEGKTIDEMANTEAEKTKHLDFIRIQRYLVEENFMMEGFSKDNK